MIHFHPADMVLKARGMASSTIAGPFGGTTGEAWNDGSIYNGIQEINLSYADAIGTFNAVYDLNGNTYPGSRHYAGVGSAYTQETIKLNYPDEYLVKVTGYVGPLPGTKNNVVRSLSFTTNQGKTYGPYGVQQGTTFTASGPRILGFIGRTSNDYLDAIGFCISS